MKNTILPHVAKETYYGFTFPHAKRYQTISRGIKNETFNTWANLIERIQELHEILKGHYGEKLKSPLRMEV